MHRHLLEENLEQFWEETGVEFKFIRSSADSDDMDFFRGPPAQEREGEDVASTGRHVAPIFVSGSSITGERNYRVTASSQGNESASSSAAQKRMY